VLDLGEQRRSSILVNLGNHNKAIRAPAPC
jgi:hypothetical protein